MTTIRTLLICVLAAAPLAAQFSFERVELRTGYGEAREGDKGRLEFTPDAIRFLSEDGGAELFSIPAQSPVKLFYSSIEGRKSGTPWSKPFDMLGGKRHFLTISLEHGKMVGAVELKLHKSNYQSIIRNFELLTGLTAEHDEPAQVAAQEVEPTETPARDEPALLEIHSTPEGAEIEIDKSFNGLTPRRKSVEAGQYRIVIRKDGYEPFERLVTVDPGQTLEVHGELRQLSATAR
jgi:hypothetical protein